LGAGGAGTSNSITGTAVVYGVGGLGGVSKGTAGGSVDPRGANGTANRGNGGGSGSVNVYSPFYSGGGSGGSGIVALKYPDTLTIAVGAGLTASTAAPSGGFKVTTVTAGTGSITFS
jgi:hypothetical protein